MDQIKIGKFISTLRKEQNMTQAELAAKLGVTDRAVSKWENGRGLPDLSFIVPLSEALDISINELLSGERIEKEHYQEKLEENIVQTIEFSKKKVKSTRKIFFSILAIMLIMVFLLGTLFNIDVGRMLKNEEVVFSTWGFDYFAPVDLEEENIYKAIRMYLVSNAENEAKYLDDSKSFVAMNVYLVSEKEKDALWEVDAWVLCETYYKENNVIEQDSGYSIPHKFTVKKKNDEYIVVEAQIPRDGNYYPEDIKEMFSWSVRNSINKVHRDGTIEKLSLDIEEQVELYYN